MQFIKWNAWGWSYNDKGYFATYAALAAAYPVGQAWWFATVGSTDTTWVRDTGTNAWLDSGTTPTVFLKLNQSTPQTITGGAPTISRPWLLAAYTDGLLLLNDTASDAVNTAQNSPTLDFKAHYWTSTDHYSNYFLVNTGGSFYIRRAVDGGASASVFNVDSSSVSIPGVLNSNQANLTTTSSDGVVLNSSTAALVGTPVRYSPSLRFTGRAWNTTTPASNTINFIQEVRPVSGATTSGSLYWAYDNNGGGYADWMSLSSAGLLTIYNNNIKTTNTAGLLLTNDTASDAVNTVQYSPELHFRGHRWTTDTTVDQASEWRIYNQATSGTATSSNMLYIDHSRAGAAYVNAFNLSSGGSGYFTGALGASGAITGIQGVYSNRSNLTTTSTVGFWAQETTASTAGVPVRYSPTLDFTAHAWNTTATAADNSINFRQEVIPVSGTTTSGSLSFKYDNNGGGYVEILNLGSNGGVTIKGDITLDGAVSGRGGINAIGTIVSDRAGLTTTSYTGVLIRSNTASTAGVPVRYSPAQIFTARAWNTTVTAADNTINFKNEVRPTSGATTSGSLYWGYDNNGGGYADILALNSAGWLVVTGWNLYLKSTWTSLNYWKISLVNGAIVLTDTGATTVPTTA